MLRLSVTVALGLVCGSLQAQWFKQPTVGIPRLADGKPDLAAPALARIALACLARISVAEIGLSR